MAEIVNSTAVASQVTDAAYRALLNTIAEQERQEDIQPGSSASSGAAGQSSTSPSSVSASATGEPHDDSEVKGPDAKKQKTFHDGPPVIYKLEDRLMGVLCCAVCLDLPNMTMYQCSNGHLMCTSCLSHLLADARLKDETATCPSCRCEISRALCIRNLAVEKAISELPFACQYCHKQQPRHNLGNHESEVCEERLVYCAYARIGCQWLGKANASAAHETECEYPLKPGSELMDPVSQILERKQSQVKSYQTMLDFLSYERVIITDLQLRPYRTDDFIPKLFYETARFPAFATNQWTVKARVNDNNSATQSQRTISYQLVLKTKPTTPVRILYIALKGPFGDACLEPVSYENEFTPDSLESPYRDLMISNAADVNRLIAAKMINFRLIMVHVQK